MKAIQIECIDNGYIMCVISDVKRPTTVYTSKQALLDKLSPLLDSDQQPSDANAKLVQAILAADDTEAADKAS